MDFIRHVILEFKTDLIVGLLFFLIGIIVPTFHLYWLIAGVNTAPKEQLRKIDLRYVAKIFGIFISGLGFFMILNPFILSYFDLKKYTPYIQMITVISIIISMMIFMRIKNNRIQR